MSSLLNSLSDSDYRINSFLHQKRGVYESLYGSDSTDDIDSQSETTLAMAYSIPAGNEKVTLMRTFTKALDLRFYKTMNIWVNARSIDITNNLLVRLGSSDRWS